MKNPDKKNSNNTAKSAKPKVKTETPLAEKDEVKQAEDRQRKNS